ncbi:MAG: LemA family protein [Bosea sp. (in: a-proteobacteria)]
MNWDTFAVFAAANAGVIAGGTAISVVGIMAWASHNRLAALDERCTTAFADIDVLLKHRHAVIPGLIESVKAFIKHERELLTAVLEARTEAIKAMTPELKLKAERHVTQTVNALISACDRNPDFQASQHFREFRDDLKDIENRVTASRRFYNLAVDEFNATLRQFPGNLVSKLGGLQRRPHFDLGSDSRARLDEAVAVAF